MTPGSSAPGSGPRNFVQPRRANGRRARQGLKLVNEIELLRQLATSGPWIRALEADIPASIRAEGEALAREYMVMSLDIRPGVIEGAVQPNMPAPHPPTGTMQPLPGAAQGKPAGDCTVLINLPVHSDAAWHQTVQSLSADGAAVAPILAGELPDELDQLLARHGAPLVPRPGEVVTMTCNCDAGEVCPHVAALILLVADRMQFDPSQALSLRGVSADELVERVRQVRAAAARQSASPGASAAADERAQSPLSDISLEEFWRTGPEFDDLAHLPPPNHAPHALLRRLGPSPLGGSFPLVGLLASAYDTIKAHAEQLRDESEEKE